LPTVFPIEERTVMANRKVCVFVMFEKDGKRLPQAAKKPGNARIAPPPPGGVFYVRRYEGTRQRWKQVGSDTTAALTAQMRQEDVLALLAGINILLSLFWVTLPIIRFPLLSQDP